jgi:hypothetical protein
VGSEVENNEQKVLIILLGKVDTLNFQLCTFENMALFTRMSFSFWMDFPIMKGVI